MVVTRRKPKIKRDLSIYLNNRQLQEQDKIKYWVSSSTNDLVLRSIEHVTAKYAKLIHALSKSAKIN